MTISLDLPSLIATTQDRVAHELDRWLPSAHLHPTRLHEAMRYVALGGGKRIRPLLVYATGHALGLPPHNLNGPACAVELIHTYSLVHDDLPAMDNDALRRGRPTCHVIYGEALAILVGDALQTLAFYILSHDTAGNVSAAQRLKMIETLAMASGSRGMCGGQAIDIAASGKALSLAELEDMHIHKTGALIRAGVTLAALTCPDLETTQQQRLERYARCLGLAFQIRDDILDVEGDTATLGKTAHTDMIHDKATYPAILGMAAAKQHARHLKEEALESLQDFDHRADALRKIAAYTIERIS